MSLVATFEPQAVWKHFDRILTTPRGSKKEDQMRSYVIGVAESRGLSHRTDAAGNLVVAKPAAAGKEGAAITVLQSHLDMVNEKNSDIDHDFDRDPILPERNGDYLTAVGTTLGSDNGIGVAAMLALIDAEDLAHGPLELLFTVDEETGLTGAKSLASDMLAGRRLINLDSEEEGALYVGCAGGADSNIELPLQKTPGPAAAGALSLRLSGLKGGHSGVDIHLQRGNAIKLLARALHAVSLDIGFHLADFHGGNLHNAIPREAFATLVATAGDHEALVAAVQEQVAAIRDEFRAVEPGIVLAATPAEPPAEVWDAATGATALQLIQALPHGVMSMSYDIPDLVETSTNLATAKVEEGSLAIGMSSRSSVDSALRALRQRIRAIAALAGAAVAEGQGYPGWKPDLGSALLRAVKTVHQRVLGSEPEVKAIHAGLECGLIGEKFAGMDMISFGPQIEYPHSPDERVLIDSVDRFYRLLSATLEELAA